MTATVNIRLYGPLGDQFGHKWDGVRARTVRDIISFLDMARPGFRRAIMAMKAYVFRVRIGKRYVGEKSMDFPVSDGEPVTVTISRRLAGSSSKGILTTILGAVLVAVGVFTFGSTSAYGAALIAIGASMALSGVASLLAPKNDLSDGQEDRKETGSFVFNGAKNTAQQGECVPVMIGRCVGVGGAIITAGVEAVDVLQTGANASTGTVTGNNPSRPLAQYYLP